MKRRAFIAGLGGTVAWPLMARGQHIPVVGFIGPEDDIAPFRTGLSEGGYVEGRNVTFDVRLLAGKFDGVRDVVSDLINRPVSVIVSTTPGALAAKALTSTIPVVFATGGDPVELGLVPSLNRPGGNLTGVSFLGPLMEAKRLGLLREMVPKADLIGVLLNRKSPLAETQLKEVDHAARTLGLSLHVQHVGSERDFGDAFSASTQALAGALLVGADALFYVQREALVALAADRRLPAM
jgi:putative tryptophan/tyrosine transport system substrate-binding protein